MGICYQVIMQDDFNWEYVGTSKKEKLEEFEKEFEKLKYAPKKICEWYGRVVYDLDKIPPYIEPYKSLILMYCDSAYYWDDLENWKMHKLENDSITQ